MAKVVLPFMGLQAHGKLGKGVIFQRWGSETTVKPWKKPRQPRTAVQCRDRTYFAAAGHLTHFIWNSSVLAAQIRGVRPGSMPWQAFFIGAIIGTGNEAIEASLEAWDTTANSVAWTSVAESLGVRSQKHSGAEIDEITAGEIVFLGARAAYRKALAAAPVDAQGMTTEQIEDFVEAFKMETAEYVIPPPG